MSENTNGTDKSARNEYAKKYQAARNAAVSLLVEAHKEEYQGYLVTTKAEHGIQDGAARRLENKKVKAQKMLRELAEAGVDVSSIG